MLKRAALLTAFAFVSGWINAQTLSYSFSLPACQQLQCNFPVRATDFLQGRGGSDWQVDMVVRSKISTSNLQLLAKAGRYNLVLNCSNGKCTLEAPNLSKTVNLHGAVVQEEIYLKAIAPDGVYALQPQQIANKNGNLPTTLKVRIVLDGAPETQQHHGLIGSPPKNNALQGEQIDIE